MARRRRFRKRRSFRRKKRGRKNIPRYIDSRGGIRL